MRKSSVKVFKHRYDKHRVQKRKHRIAQDEDKQTEEIELRKLRKSSVKVFKHRYEQALNTVMRK